MFWRSTPRQIARALGAAARRATREHNERMHLAWHVAHLQRARRLPRLKTLLAKVSERRRQTWQEQMAVMEQWAAHMARVIRHNEQIKRQAKKKHGRK